MFRSVLDHPQGDIFFTSVTKNKLIGFVVACLLYLLCFVLMRILPSLVVAVQQQPTTTYVTEDGQELTETWRTFKNFKQYNYFNVLFLIE